MTIDTKITKEHGYRMSMSVLIGYIPLIGIFWFLAKPILIDAVSEAVADDIQTQVEHEIKPLNTAFTALLQRDVDKLKLEIAALEYVHEDQDHPWTVQDAKTLAILKIDLLALEKALKALREEV